VGLKTPNEAELDEILNSALDIFLKYYQIK
jgi:hypothetical protein